MENLTKKFDHLYKIISSKGFLNKESLGGEIPFFISAYDAKQELEVKDSIKRLINKLSTSGVSVLELNLYDIVCEIFEERGGIEKIFKQEKIKKNNDSFLNAVQSSLNIHLRLMPKIQTKIEKSNANVYFLTGIGLVFPYIRSHNVLNNLQNVAKEAPTVAFFPGEYDGHTLRLFGLLTDDNYYRAYNIENIKSPTYEN